MGQPGVSPGGFTTAEHGSIQLAIHRGHNPPLPKPISLLRHDCKGEIVPIAAAVARLEIIAVHIHDPAVGQAAEGAHDRRRGRVLDQGQRCPLS